MRSLCRKLINKIERQGWKGQIVPISHLTDLREAILDRYQDGLFEERFYQEQLSFFSFDHPANLSAGGSIIIVAVPTPQMRVTFHWQSESFPIIIPPTYVSYTRRTESTQSLLAGWLKQLGHTLTRADLPLKTIAVCSGLAEFGRGNLCFVPGMGSFLQFVGAYTDLPSEIDPWRKPKALDRCGKCKACNLNCSTGAITEDRFLIHAERCLTYHNEAKRDFPKWIDPSWHHCLIGCMRCQTICPENKQVINWFEDRVAFSEKETDLLLQQMPFDQLPEMTAAKLKSLEINEEYCLLCRNLSMILGQYACAC